MHKFVAVTFGLFLALSTLTATQAFAGGPRYYCPPTYVRPVQPVYREPNWYRYRESYGGYRSYDYHELRGEYSSDKSWRTSSYEANFGYGHSFDEHQEEHFRYPGHTRGYGTSPVFP